MKVLHIGNMANNAYSIVKAMRARGIEADLIVDRGDVVTSQPEWEEIEIREPLPLRFSDWERLDLGEWCQPSWIHVYRGGRVRNPLVPRGLGIPYTNHLRKLLQLTPRFRHYDLVQAYVLDPVLCLAVPGTPFVAFCTGDDINIIPFTRTITGVLMRVAYRRAARIFCPNGNMVRSAAKLGLKQAEYMPFLIDTKRYASCEESLRVELVSRYGPGPFIFSPARQDWAVKGNDKMLRAMSRIRRDYPSMRLMLVGWGDDVEASRHLVAELGLEAAVIWLPLLSKPRLIRYYNAADVVLDQFNLGAFGTTTLEAMGCGKAVVLDFDNEQGRACHPELPPVIRAGTEDEIAESVARLLAEPAWRSSVGEASRAWIERFHGPEVVVQRHLAAYEAVLKGRAVPV